jgi:hypothetical protein
MDIGPTDTCLTDIMTIDIWPTDRHLANGQTFGQQTDIWAPDISVAEIYLVRSTNNDHYCDQPFISETMRCLSNDFIENNDNSGQNVVHFYL